MTVSWLLFYCCEKPPTYKRKTFNLGFKVVESMTIMAGSTAVGRCGAGAVAESLHPYPQVGGRELTGNGVGF